MSKHLLGLVYDLTNCKFNISSIYKVIIIDGEHNTTLNKYLVFKPILKE